MRRVFKFVKKDDEPLAIFIIAILSSVMWSLVLDSRLFSQEGKDFLFLPSIALILLFVALKWLLRIKDKWIAAIIFPVLVAFYVLAVAMS